MSLIQDQLTLAPVDQISLSQQIYERIKHSILTGQFSSGERLSMDALAKHFQVSAMPIRDALKQLEADELVEIRPRRGVFVTEVSSSKVHELFQVRRIIERACVENLSDLPVDLIPRLQSTVDEMESLQSGQTYREYPAFVRLDTHFHNLIIGIPGNESLAKMYEELRWPIQLVLVLSKSQSQRAEETLVEHQKVIEALAVRDVEQAQAAITVHLLNAEKDLLKNLS